MSSTLANRRARAAARPVHVETYESDWARIVSQLHDEYRDERLICCSILVAIRHKRTFTVADLEGLIWSLKRGWLLDNDDKLSAELLHLAGVRGGTTLQRTGRMVDGYVEWRVASPARLLNVAQVSSADEALVKIRQAWADLNDYRKAK